MEDAALIDWEGSESHLLLSPRMPGEIRSQLERQVTPLDAHVWLATSGTTGSIKLVALSKRAMLASAAAVNRRLEVSASDVWYGVLPTFHVGGLSIHARAWLSACRLIEEDWNPLKVAGMDFTLISLVPAQIADLVRLSLPPPPRLRAAVVGGGALRDDLYESAMNLGWPILETYGMTECCSQVATALPGSRELVMLDHLAADVSAEGLLQFRGASLLTGYGSESGLRDPKRGGWFVSEDEGEVTGDRIRVHGRRGGFVKIGGESVDLGRLERLIESISGGRAAVLAAPDDRLGHVIHLVLEAGTEGAGIEQMYNEQVFPYERARVIRVVQRLPRTELGKLQIGELRAMLDRPE
jgi:O-succinylbenzoic acid--CoA ligase